ncbi:PREDICTED: uncharacterized protein LOC109486545 [Branchiostoma belcheri]|uniref:Gypsy retrotransposon integrase-like protein 1 n=1 Tax=Branchiostoma belcheri TaxID=7741 RepID=A0A6P4ZXN7_BRABE|nr:PREDICTED: uncharacterized protein LOC109486545 [Branchiostoma belcheri]
MADQLRRLEVVPDASAQSMRALAVSYLTQHPCWPEAPGEPLVSYLVDSEFHTWEEYLFRLALNGEVWGDHMTLEALARALGIGVRVVKVTDGVAGKPVEIWPGHESPRVWVLLGLVDDNHYVSLGGTTINSLRTSSAQEPWLTELGQRDMSSAQLNDPTIGPVLKDKLAQKDKPDKTALADASRHTLELYKDWDLLEVHNGILYRVGPQEDNPTQKQLLVPRVLVSKVLSCVHDSPAGGHLGVDKTKEKLLRGFYWPGLTKDVIVHVTCCDICAKTKGGRRRPRAPLQPSAVGYPNKRIAIDVVGPLPKTSSGNKYVLVLSDYFTKWVEIFAIPDETASTVARVIFEGWVCVHGPPERIHTDQGRNFESTLIAELCKYMRIGKTRTTPYHPQSDGMVERFNRTLGNILRAYVSANQRDWDVHLPMVKFAFNTSEHSTTKFTPYFIMHGREARLPVELMFGIPSAVSAPVQEYVRDMVDKFPQIFKFVSDNTKQANKRQKELFDKKVYGAPFQEGDKVLVARKAVGKGLARKLAHRYEGPFIVVERVGENAYRIRKPRSNDGKVVHFENIVPYREREEDPDYLPPLPRRARHHAITPGGFVPPPVISDDSSLSDSDDDTLATEATIQQAGAPTAGSDDDPSNSEDVGDAGQSDIADVGDVSQQAVGNLSDGVQQVVPALAADDATGVLMESDASDGETAQPPGREQTGPMEASGSEDEQDDAPAPRRSTRSCQPPVRYGFHVNSIDTDKKPKTLSDMHPLKRTCNNAKSCIQRSTRGSGIEGRCPEVVRQVPRPSTPGQREIGKGTWASDMFVGSVLGSTLQFLLA